MVGKPAAEEYPVDVVDIKDDFAQQKTMDITLKNDPVNRIHRYWIFLKCMKWQIELRPNSFEVFCAYFNAPSTWAAEVEFEMRIHITNSVRTEKFLGRFSGSSHVYFKPLRIHEHMQREKLAEVRVEIQMNVISLTNFGMIYDYFDMMQDGESTFLKVEDKLIKVDRRYLALMSPFFKALFFGEMGVNQEVYELKEKFREMITFLRCIYPHRQPVTKKSLDFLLQLADRYQCQPMVDACEMFMCAHYHEYQKRTEKCFSYVEKYKMQRLLRIVVEYVAVTQNTAQFRAQPYWRDLSEKTQLAVLESMAKTSQRKAKEMERRRGVNAHRANIDPIDDQHPPSGRLLGIADPHRNADPHQPPPPVRYVGGNWPAGIVRQVIRYQ
uniref:BTB domain-containing protein n=1 Tax=Caenorhabditis tropicalis TaxID=1561998 RepID=A0A1I7TWS7_9PELO